jgi:hypothetical protein
VGLLLGYGHDPETIHDLGWGGQFSADTPPVVSPLQVMPKMTGSISRFRRYLDERAIGTVAAWS